MHLIFEKTKKLRTNWQKIPLLKLSKDVEREVQREWKNMQVHRRAAGFFIGTIVLKIGSPVFEQKLIFLRKLQKISKASQKNN